MMTMSKDVSAMGDSREDSRARGAEHADDAPGLSHLRGPRCPRHEARSRVSSERKPPGIWVWDRVKKRRAPSRLASGRGSFDQAGASGTMTDIETRQARQNRHFGFTITIGLLPRMAAGTGWCDRSVSEFAAMVNGLLPTVAFIGWTVAAATTTT